MLKVKVHRDDNETSVAKKNVDLPNKDTTPGHCKISMHDLEANSFISFNVIE